MDGVREVGHNGGWYGFLAIVVFVAVTGKPHGNPLLTGFVELQRADARLI